MPFLGTAQMGDTLVPHSNQEVNGLTDARYVVPIDLVKGGVHACAIDEYNRDSNTLEFDEMGIILIL